MIKRRILIVLASVLSTAGLAVITYVLAASLGPSDIARGSVVREVETDVIQPGESLMINWLGNPVIFAKNFQGEISSFVGVSTYRNCLVVYSPPGDYGEHWKGGWIDPCHIGAWDETGRFVPNVNSGGDVMLNDLPKPKELGWDGTIAVLYK